MVLFPSVFQPAFSWRTREEGDYLKLSDGKLLDHTMLYFICWMLWFLTMCYYIILSKPEFVKSVPEDFGLVDTLTPGPLALQAVKGPRSEH